MIDDKRANHDQSILNQGYSIIDNQSEACPGTRVETGKRDRFRVEPLEPDEPDEPDELED